MQQTLAKARTEIARGDARLAKDRLLGLLSTYPESLEVRRALQLAYRRIGDQVQAGRWGFHVEAQSTVDDDERKAFVRWAIERPRDRRIAYPLETLRRLLRWPGAAMPANTFAAELWRNLEIKEARARRRARVGCVVDTVVFLAFLSWLLLHLVRAMT
jgi:hypothetical protein